MGRLRILGADHHIRRIETRDGKVMLTGPQDYLMQGARFPRLRSEDVDERLEELAELIGSSGQWAR
jgi:hypothetical protein